MADQVTVIDNEKYRKMKRRQEAAQAWMFLLPNFLGFLIITFLPIFATFVLSFTEWDGKSTASPAIIEMKFVSDETTPEDFEFPEGSYVEYEEILTKTRQVSVTLAYEILQDIVIPAGSMGNYPFMDMNSLRQPSQYSYEGSQLFKVIKGSRLQSISEEYNLKISEEEFQYIYEGNILSPTGGISTSYPRLSAEIDGISGDISINTTGESGKEMEITVLTDDEIVIPAGTILFADMIMNKVVKTETNIYTFNIFEVEKKGEIIEKAPKLDTTLGEKYAADQNGEVVTIEKMIQSYSAAATDVKVATEGTPEYEAAVSELEGFISEMNALLVLKDSDGNIIENVTIVAENMKETGNNGLRGVGFENYVDLLTNDSRFWYYFGNTLIFLLEIPLGMAASLIMALAMNQPLKGIVIFRVLYFLPNISNIVAVAVLWRWILNSDYGFLNGFLRSIGISNPPQWFANPKWAKVAIMIVDVWKGAGYNMMLYLAGLQGIPGHLYEAAEIDGASNWQQFWKITWPLLGPTNFFILIMGVIGGFQAFGTQFVMTAGGPAGSTTTIVYYIYNHAYKWEHMGYATAIAVVLFIFVMILTIINWTTSEGNVEY